MRRLLDRLGAVVFPSTKVQAERPAPVISREQQMLEATRLGRRLGLSLSGGFFFICGALILAYEGWQRLTWVKAEGVVIEKSHARKSVGITYRFTTPDRVELIGKGVVPARIGYEIRYNSRVALRYSPWDAQRNVLAFEQEHRRGAGISMFAVGSLALAVLFWLRRRERRKQLVGPTVGREHIPLREC